MFLIAPLMPTVERAAVGGVHDDVGVQLQVRDEMRAGESEKASDLAPARLDEIGEASARAPGHIRHARPAPDHLVLRRAGDVVPEHDVRTTVEESLDDRLDIGRMGGHSILGIAESRAAHVDLHEHTVPPLDQRRKWRIQIFHDPSDGRGHCVCRVTIIRSGGHRGSTRRGEGSAEGEGTAEHHGLLTSGPGTPWMERPSSA